MALRKEEFQALIEREGLMDFIWARTYDELKKDLGIYELANDRWGFLFFIFPPVIVNTALQNNLASFFNSVELPDRSSLQFISFASRNISGYIHLFDKVHREYESLKVKNKEALKELVDNQVEWLKKHPNESIFEDAVDFRIRNFVNLVAVTIPREDKHGVEYSTRQLLTFINKLRSQMDFLNPVNCSMNEYLRIMREILIPDQPFWYPEANRNIYLNYQVVDNDSALTIEDDFGTIGLGKIISKKEFEKRESSAIESAKVKKESSFLSKLFGSKEDKNEDRIAYTRWHAKVLTTKTYPESIALIDLGTIMYDYFGERDAPLIPSPYFMSLIVYFENRDKVKREVTEKAKWNIWQTQSLGKAAKYFPEIVERAKEAEAVNKLVSEGMNASYATLSIVIFDDSIDKVEKHAEAVKRSFLNNKNWIWQDEILIPHWIFLYHLPINFEPFVLKDLSKRMNTVFSDNIATITPLTTGFKGFGTPVLSYIDRNGQIAGVDIYEGTTNYNAIIVGESGSGKSYLSADLFTKYLMNGTRIRVIDMGESYKALCNFVGGQYISFDSESDTSFNFFTNVKTNERGMIDAEDMASIVSLIGLMAMKSLDPADVSNEDTTLPALMGKIEQAVNKAFEMKKFNAGMQEVLIALKQMQEEFKEQHRELDQALNDLINALYAFGDPNGEYFSYFNSPNNIHFSNSDFVVFDLDALEHKTQLKPVVLASIIHMINKEIFLEGLKENRKTIIAIDEAWALLNDKIVARYLLKASKRIRKYYGSLIVILQSITDLTQNEVSKAIIANAQWRFFLQQRPDSIQQAENDPDLKFDPGVVRFMETISKKDGLYSEVLIENSGSNFMIGRLVPDRVSHWIFANSPIDRREILKIMEEKGISQLDARLIKGYSEKNGTSIDEEFQKRLESGLMNFVDTEEIEELKTSEESS